MVGLYFCLVGNCPWWWVVLEPHVQFQFARIDLDGFYGKLCEGMTVALLIIILKIVSHGVVREGKFQRHWYLNCSGAFFDRVQFYYYLHAHFSLPEKTQSQSQCGHTVWYMWYTLWTTLCSQYYDCVDLAHFHTMELCKHSVNHSVTTP